MMMQPWAREDAARGAGGYSQGSGRIQPGEWEDTARGAGGCRPFLVARSIMILRTIITLSPP